MKKLIHLINKPKTETQLVFLQKETLTKWVKEKTIHSEIINVDQPAAHNPERHEMFSFKLQKVKDNT